MILLRPALVQGLRNVTSFSLHPTSQAATAETPLLYNQSSGDYFNCIGIAQDWGCECGTPGF